MRSLKPTGLTAIAAGVLLAAAACSPVSSEPGTPSAGTSSPAPSAAAAPSAPGATATIGTIVPGFPESLLPVMPGATVISSSFDKTATPATAALVASIAAPSATVVDFYTKQLEGQGFKAVPGDAVGAVTSKDFVRNGTETVNVASVEAAGVSTFTVGANVAVESAK